MCVVMLTEVLGDLHSSDWWRLTVVWRQPPDWSGTKSFDSAVTSSRGEEAEQTRERRKRISGGGLLGGSDVLGGVEGEGGDTVLPAYTTIQQGFERLVEATTGRVVRQWCACAAEVESCESRDRRSFGCSTRGQVTWLCENCESMKNRREKERDEIKHQKLLSSKIMLRYRMH